MAFNYHCFNSECWEKCGHCNNKGDLIINESGDYTCPNNPEEKLKEMGTVVGGFIMGDKMSREQITADRTKRRKDHFQKEVMPTLAPVDQLGFMSKGYRNK